MHVDEYAEAWSKANQSAPEIAKVWFKRDTIKVLPIVADDCQRGPGSGGFPGGCADVEAAV